MKSIRFDNKVAVVTGGGRGLGRSYALELARRGAQVVVNDPGGLGSNTGSWAEAVVDEIQVAGGKAVASLDSVATPEGGRAIADAALSAFGTVDILINNAGIIRSAMFEDMTVAQINDVLGVHLLGAFYVTQPLWPVLKKKRYGRVVMTSSGSIFGMQANANYVASKAGLLGLTRALALEGADYGIKVNALIPYAVSNISVDNPLVGPDVPEYRTLLNKISDRRTPESVAAMALLLASKACQFNGEAFSILGGRYARAFIGVGEGWLSEDISVSVEDIDRHIETICDPANYASPMSMAEEIATVVDRLAIDRVG